MEINPDLKQASPPQALDERGLTPLMRQYWEIKNQHPDKILLFRMGDFFEIFHQDAVLAAPIVGIALTSRNKKSQDETPMCGVPHHAIAGPIEKLLSAGHKVAICDQLEDPKFAKGLVKRGVTRVLTPGMLYDTQNLDAGQPNYMAAFVDENLAIADTSSGETFWLTCARASLNEVLQQFPIVELVVENPAHAPAGLRQLLTTVVPPDLEVSFLTRQSEEPAAVLLLKRYLFSLGGAEVLKILRPFERRSLQKRMHISGLAAKHLELFETYDGDKRGSFLSSIDRTRTAGGRRMLRYLVGFPAQGLDEILATQGRVRAWAGADRDLGGLRDELTRVGDLERRLGRLTMAQVCARDLVALAHSIQAAIRSLDLAKAPTQVFAKTLEMSEKWLATFLDDAPLNPRQGFMIREGIRADLDNWIRLSTQGQTYLQELEEKERKLTGIGSLKIRYNNVFGYYIEITHTHKDKVPDRFQRKQTLANAERFCTDELLELERKILSAQENRFALEYEIFLAAKSEALSLSSEILTLATRVSELDVESSFAWLMIERNYILPELGGPHLILAGSRHPVVEQLVSQKFVPNDLTLRDQEAILLTGPNMAGKSTLMRQVALSAILAQMGAPVPATRAEMPIFDSVWTRIGASDQLTKGLSTFMVEMTETSEMLKRAGPQSLVILDEVGRGTSTYDGLSLAQSILEHLLSTTKAYVLFATHYHELTRLEPELRGLRNFHMKMNERGSLQFLYTLTPGPAKKSYGIKVGAMAGLPTDVVKRAEDLLRSFEKRALKDPRGFEEGIAQMDFFDTLGVETGSVLSSSAEIETGRQKVVEEVVREIQNLDLSGLTPLEALNKIAKYQRELQNAAD